MSGTRTELVTAASRSLLWQLQHAQSRIWLASPYVSMPAAKKLIEKSAAGVSERRLLTSVSEGSVRAGVLSAKALLELQAKGFVVARKQF
ncbi:MAG TPA: hypothetical protein VGO36_08095 [Solirubrobacterales bacterium]|jgi:hypothetical protein|nr:hypothetical protein [Solirubrobacterales bacterium]